jgi:hypothetical protein
LLVVIAGSAERLQALDLRLNIVGLQVEVHPFLGNLLVAGGVLDDGQVTAAFTQAALTIGLEAAEVARTLASARAAGLANPRSLPIPNQRGRLPARF